ncbi:hypothetical protein [Ferrovibrio sp.]|uniref:hypothetical protein n=1 Tax=Ferrovibrio sp. TaxID=1917215 RepID=UPI0026024DB1|nr:hypothetical protein [Ferrovibrio sp.]
MKSDYAIIIERTAFEVALSTMVTGHRQALRDPHWCMLLSHASGLQVETAWLTATLEGDGQWSRPVRAAARLLLPLAGRLGSAPSLRLLYVSERLFIDGLPVEAMDMGMFRPAFTSGTRMRAAVQRQLFRPEALTGRKASWHIQAPLASLPLFSADMGAEMAGNLPEEDL